MQTHSNRIPCFAALFILCIFVNASNDAQEISAAEE